MSRKGRHGSVRHPERMARGERNGNSKLNDAKVFEIHRLTRAGMTQTAIARRFLVSRMTVRRIIRRENWRQVED
jgi:DNA invertase Pin-like site-specific DNA recombinase